MIFKQYELVITGEKTETRRLHCPVYAGPGKTLAAVPKPSLPAHWYGFIQGIPATIDNPAVFREINTLQSHTTAAANRWLAEHGFIQARIEVLARWQEQLQAITQEGALAEGVSSVDDYAALWDSINNRPGKRWGDNPLIWVVRFQPTAELCDMIARHKQQGSFEV